MTAKPTMPSAPGDTDSTNRATPPNPADLKAATPALARMPGARETPETTVRRPYQAPRILFREPLEAMAAICSPHPPAKANKGLCPMGPISS
ncbi:MAG TPA: hypothetical protein VHB47_19200 [Thermoanaerobaculia bacterium]|jgi:hypothetical protein|nr:hypothetical protein [Thermoanaerobaculia bacterium]